MSILEVIIVGITILVGTRIILRILFGDDIVKEYWKNRGYKAGYDDGHMNTRMYFSIYKELPSTNWTARQVGKHLNTREKLLAATQERDE